MRELNFTEGPEPNQDDACTKCEEPVLADYSYVDGKLYCGRCIMRAMGGEDSLRGMRKATVEVEYEDIRDFDDLVQRLMDWSRYAFKKVKATTAGVIITNGESLRGNWVQVL